MAKIYYSIEDAEKIVKKLEERIERIMKLNDDINDITELQVNIKGDEVEEQLFALDLNRKFHKASHKLYEEMYVLTEIGCIEKDLELGLVDFYSRYEDRDILLCWRYGEKGIKHWHEVDACYKMRKPVSILKNEYQEKLRKLR